MSTLSTWYHNQYSTWNRTRMLRAPQFMARTETNTSRTATAIARRSQDAVVINMGELSSSANSEANKKDKKQDSLFGPNIGVVNAGPKWTEENAKKGAEDQLTPDVVNAWIAKSKEASQPTTTLQALVNLKRPTLRLSPLTVSPDDDATHINSQHHHGLEFEYDCDAPKCGIYVHVLVDSGTSQEDGDKLSKVMVFESIVEGGFGKVLKLEEGATLELGSFEMRKVDHTPTTEGQPGTSSAEAGQGESSGPESTTQPRDRKRRFTNTFPFRKRFQGRQVSGPALAVVDADPSPSLSTSADTDKKGEADDEGVKVIIRLAALDKEGTELGNEQVTYLHVVRFGEKMESEETKDKAEDKDAVEEDNRPWVVKVVKREATIGLHTFHLHEIYGLSSQSTTNQTPSLPTVSPTSSPTSNAYPPTESMTEDPSAASECLLCLSSPREVVLLPCRHLVACRDCALNMVEFGAGGTITQAAEETPAGGDAAATEAGPDVAEGGAGTTAPSGALASTAPTATARRKRKAKGWFCPVCRQPYTSLLRLTTNPPAPASSEDESKDNDAKDVESTEGPMTTEVPSSGTPPSGRGRSYTPSFLRSLSRGGSQTVESATSPVATPTAPTPTLAPDVERGTVTT